MQYIFFMGYYKGLGSIHPSELRSAASAQYDKIENVN